MHVLVKELPQVLQSQLSGIDYHRLDIEVVVSDKISLLDAGTQGYQGFSVMVNLETGEASKRVGSWGGANMFTPSNQVDNDRAEYVIPVNGAVIKGSRGQHLFAKLYVSRGNFIKALPLPGIELTAFEKGVLRVIYSTKASHRKECILGSYSDSYFDRPLTESEYADTVNLLAGKGLVKVNKAGAVSITTDGKNLV